MTESLAVLDGLVPAILMADQNEADKVSAASTRRLAAMAVRRDVLHHPCQGGAGCRHRNHRRDIAHASLLLEALELPGVPAVPEDYKSDITWGSFSKDDAKII